MRGDRPRATLREVAAAAGVSAATVSRALRGDARIAAGTRKRVRRAAARAGYVPNVIARSLVQRRTATVGLVLADIRNPFYTELARSVQETLQGAGYALILGNSNNSAEEELKEVRALIERQVDGVVLTPTVAAGRALQLLRAQAVPFALLDSGPAWTWADRVMIDHDRGGYLAARHLLDQGYPEVVLVNGPRQMPSSGLLAAGFRRAVEEAGGHGRVRFADLTQAGGYEETRKLIGLLRGPVGVFYASDVMAFGALRALREAGRSIPADVGVVGYDNLPVCDLVSPPLTSIDQAAYALGESACRLLLERLGSPRSEAPVTLTIEPSLIVRASSVRGVPPGSPAPP